MKKAVKILSLLLTIVMLVVVFVACGDDDGGAPPNPGPQGPQHIDYVGDLKLDMNSNTLKQSVTVKNHVDGDTVHFNVPTTVVSTGVLKARFLAVNTPESTGKIEDYGHKASDFTKAALKNAHSIIVESDDNNWNVDSTGGRYLVWIWYKPTSDSEYRNLNVELLQEGLAIGSNTANNRYGEIAFAALNQAKTEKLYVHSGVKDPEVYSGEAIALTIKELRANIADYENKKVAFEGVVVQDFNQTVYVEAYDDETDMYYGMTVYYGYNLSGTGLEILAVGNKVRIVGTVQYYETGGTWQVSDVQYREFVPDDPNNLKLISSGHAGTYRTIAPATFANGKVAIEIEKEDSIETVSYDFAELALSASISMENLTITSIYTTDNDASSQNGAMTFTCRASDGTTIDVRTVVLRDEQGNLLTEADFKGKTISVKGIVDFFSGDYQIKVFKVSDITIVG